MNGRRTLLKDRTVLRKRQDVLNNVLRYLVYCRSAAVINSIFARDRLAVNLRTEGCLSDIRIIGRRLDLNLRLVSVTQDPPV